MKKYSKYIVFAVIIVIGILCYSRYAFIDGDIVKINAEKIIYESGYEQDVRLNAQLGRLKQLKSLSLKIKDNDDLSCLKGLSNLQELTLVPLDEASRNNWDPKSVSHISSVKKLIICCFIKKDMDCSFLSELNDLESISSMDSNIWNWDFVENSDKLKNIRIVMLHECNDFKWDGLSFSKSLEEFEANLIHYDRSLLESLENIPSINKIHISFADYESLDNAEKQFIEEWTNNMKSRHIDVIIE